MKKKLLAALLAALLLLSGCQYSVVEDADEQQLLRGNAAIAETATPSPTAQPLQNGSRDGEGESAVSDLQKRLQALNYLDGKADGIFGEDTQAALEAFQALNGLPETGVLDAGTQAALGSAMAVPMPTPEPTPLAKGAKIYSDSNNSNIKEADAVALAAFGTVVETMDEADVIVYHTTSFDENFDYIVEDSQAAGKPLVLIFEGTIGRSGAQGEPYWPQVEPCEAVLMQTYNNTPDPGSSIGAFYRYVTPSITAQMLFGEKDPSGSTVFEVPYTAEDAYTSWGELQMDIAVDEPTRLYMAMLAKENPTIDMPNNLGDVLYTTEFGMSYANPAEIELSLLTAPEVGQSVTTENNGRTSTTIEVSNAVQKAGVPFEVCFVAKNNGGDGHVTAQIMEGDTVLAEKFVAVDGGQFRVITMELTLDAGEHTISLGDMSTTIVVE